MIETKTFTNPPDETRSFFYGPLNSVRSLEILLIEDNPADSVRIQRLLSDSPHVAFNVTEAVSLGVGIDQIESTEQGIDAVLLDLSLPDSSGLETYSRLSELYPELAIVVLSGHDDEALAIETVQRGAQDYLVKDQIDANLLSRSIQYSMERMRASIEIRRAKVELEDRVAERTAELLEMQEQAQRQRDELARIGRLNLLGEMASGLAHELNQPLMAIVGFAQSCLKRIDDDNVDLLAISEVLRDIAAEGTRSGEIIKRLRSLVQRHESIREEVDLNELVRDTHRLIQHELKSRAADFDCDLPTDCPSVSGDRIQLQQVLLNLITNSLQALQVSKKKRGRVHVKTSHDPEQNSVSLIVSDNGPGMAADQLKRLFEPFYTTKSDGLGLGLSISQSIIQAHNGRISAMAEPYSGMTVRVTVPVTG